MGNFACKNESEKDDTTRVLITGLFGAGKTATLYRLKHGELWPTEHTYDTNVETILHKYHSFNTWDMGGRNQDNIMYRIHYTMSNCLIHVIDSSCRDDLDQAIDQLETILDSGRKVWNIPILILANKQDLPDVMTPEEIYNKVREAKSMRSRTWTVFGTSAKTGDGFNECLDWLSDELDNSAKSGHRKKSLVKKSKGSEESNKDMPTNAKHVAKMSYFTNMIGALKKMVDKK